MELKDEASSIVNYIYLSKIATDEYPENLSDYEFRNPNHENYFTYQHFRHKDAFRLSYFVGSKSTSYWYSNSSTYWDYYDD
ncbi:hypothetical protein [Rasiella sp. SM2506]|uniref:hypothetical protein n=1 Tax=Rasiella sp. SM2506 TaxID=3423914 RepID=UPI003D7BA69A